MIVACAMPPKRRMANQIRRATQASVIAAPSIKPASAHGLDKRVNAASPSPVAETQDRSDNTTHCFCVRAAMCYPRPSTEGSARACDAAQVHTGKQD